MPNFVVEGQQPKKHTLLHLYLHSFKCKNLLRF